MSPTARRTIADRAFLLAIQAWAGGDEFPPSGRFRPGWREGLDDARERGSEAGAAAARDALRRAQSAQARPDRGHVHPSWWVRALKDESPSVQRALAAHADPALRPILRQGLGLDPSDLEPDHPPHPDALRWALGLWAERIVGDLPAWPDDPPIVVALSRLGLREVIALARTTGLAKLALAAVEPPTLRLRARARFDAFGRAWGEPDPPACSQARRDCEENALGGRRGQGWGRLGLVTFGRLLAVVEPYRTRWALQHLPYALARRVRPAIKHVEGMPADREGEVLRLAWERLAAEGRIRALGSLSH